jgi:hypothetical protein
MKLYNYFFISAPLACSLCIATPVTQFNTKSDDVKQMLNMRDAREYIYPTKFGDMKFIRADGTPGEPAEKITLNTEILLSTKDQVGSDGGPLFLMSESQTITSREKVARRAGESGKTKTIRMIVLIGQGTCTKKLAILDFTGVKPFISQQFGNDRENRSCLAFKKAKWGKKESEIILSSGATYIYDANGTISGPFVFE